MASQIFDPETFGKQAVEVAGILRALANERRLMILCRLVECGEANVSALAEAVGLSQSALSQHLARLRQGKLVRTRREAQTIYYSLADPGVSKVLAALYEVYCRPARRA